MPSTGLLSSPSQADSLDDLQLAAVEAPPTGRPQAVYDRAQPLRLVCIRAFNYVTNHVVAHVPSFTVRRLWYQHALGIDFGRHASVFMGVYMWFHGGPREIRRQGVAIGENSRINRDCTLDVRGGLTIGDNVSISPEVMIVAGSHDVNDPTFPTVDPGPVSIRDHVFIGSRAMIVGGVTVGRGAVIAAGSVVTKDVPPMTIVAGVPAKQVGVRAADRMRIVKMDAEKRS